MKYLQIVAMALAILTTAVATAQDADDAYRDARRALNRAQYDDAIAGFQALRRNYPSSEYVSDSFYFEALALERNGDLEAAVAAIDRLLGDYPNASTADDARARRVQVCSALANQGDSECAALVSETVRNTDELDIATRMAAVRALINMRAERAVPIAAQVVANRSQPLEVRRQALFVLADKAEDGGNTAEATDILHTVALDETENAEMREQAVFWLSQIPGEQTLNLLTGLVNSSVSVALKERAIFALSQHDDPRAIELLRSYAIDTALNTQLRKRAIFWIGEEGGSQSLPFLTGLYPDLTDSELREQVLFAVSEAGGDDAAEWLLGRARDGSESMQVRRRALFWAAEAGLSTAELNELYASTSERELREHLIWLISENGGEGSIDSLLDIARNDPDPELRRRAVFWLGESDDPRAAELILELLGQ
jgi:HEAT repeat protein